MHLKGGEALVISIRRSETAPTKYAVMICKASTHFSSKNSIEIAPFEIPVANVGEFAEFKEALDTAVERLQDIELSRPDCALA